MNSPMARSQQIEQIDQLMYNVVWHSQKQMAHTLTRPDIDLTLPQLMTLLAVQESGACRMTALAELTRQSAGTLTGIVDRLIGDGLLRRTRNTSDRRVIEVALTVEGKRRLDTAAAARREGMHAALDRFSEGELERFAQLLERFLKSLDLTPFGNG